MPTQKTCYGLILATGVVASFAPCALSDGPYGGSAYWGSFSYVVPTYSDGVVLRSRW